MNTTQEKISNSFATGPIIGHRGASACAPENTLASFNKAVTLGCHFIEFDVMLSSDGEPFVFHDNTLERTTNGAGQFGRVSAKYLRSLDAGSWFSDQYKNEKIPHLNEVLEWLLSSRVHANIEIKPYPGTTQATTKTILAYLDNLWPRDRESPLLSSFDYSALEICHALAPERPLGLLLDKWDRNWLQKAKKLQCYSLHINHRALKNRVLGPNCSTKRIQAIKAENYPLFVYTVNCKQLAKQLFTQGVDAVFSDDPNLLS
jgi:glycerophosphoryl diester phosphodiesterase